jgi:hypothetical protein
MNNYYLLYFEFIELGILIKHNFKEEFPDLWKPLEFGDNCEGTFSFPD